MQVLIGGEHTTQNADNSHTHNKYTGTHTGGLGTGSKGDDVATDGPLQRKSTGPAGVTEVASYRLWRGMGGGKGG